MSASSPQNVPNLSSRPFSTAGGADPASVEHIRNGPQRGRTSSLRLADHRHDVSGKSIGLYSVYTRGLRFGDAWVAQANTASLSARACSSVLSGGIAASGWKRKTRDMVPPNALRHRPNGDRAVLTSAETR
jgi:hypothetical protein